MRQATSRAREVVLIFYLPDALAPSLIAMGFTRVDGDTFTRGDDDWVEFSVAPIENMWWVIIAIDGQLRSESKVDSIIQALRILWTFNCIELIEQVTVNAEA